jgi:hypothetical protein
MRQKINVTILAAVISLAVAGEALTQFDSLKTSVNDWTRTSILGSLLVYAADGAQSPARDAQPTVLLAHASAAADGCAGQRSTSAAREGRPASRTRIAANERAHAAEESARGLGELAMGFAAEPNAPMKSKVREEFVFKVMPRIAEAAKWQSAAVEEEEAAGAVRARGGVEAGAARARAAAELKKLGLRKVFVRVAQAEGVSLPARAFEFRLPEPLPPAPAAKPHAGLGDEAPDGEAHDAPAAAPGFVTLFSTPAPTASLNCDSDPRS